jgi:hypothetical protein
MQLKSKGLRQNCSDYRSLSELKVGLLGVGEMGQALARVFAGQLRKKYFIFYISHTIIPWEFLIHPLNVALIQA